MKKKKEQTAFEAEVDGSKAALLEGLDGNSQGAAAGGANTDGYKGEKKKEKEKDKPPAKLFDT